MLGDGCFGGALQIQINRQHHILPRLRLAPDVFRLTIALTVDQQRFRARATAQFVIEAIFHADHAVKIRQPIIKKRFLALGRTIVVLQIAEQVHRRVAQRIAAHGLQFQVSHELVGEIFLKPRDLCRIEFFQYGQGNGAFLLVAAREFLRIHRHRLAQFLADLRGDSAHDIVTRLPGQGFNLVLFQAHAVGFDSLGAAPKFPERRGSNRQFYRA